MTTRKTALTLLVAFLLVWYAVSQRSYEHLTGAPILGDEDKKAVRQYLEAKIHGGKPEDVKLTAKAKDFVRFLEDHPISSIDDAYVTKYLELEKQSVNGITIGSEDKKGHLKQQFRDIASLHVLATAIWGYADYYEKAETTPSRSQFDRDMFKVVKNDPKLNMAMNTSRQAATNAGYLEQEIKRIETQGLSENEKVLARLTNKSPEDETRSKLDQLKSQLAREQQITLATGDDQYPFPATSSPIISQLLDTVYTYYYGGSSGGGSLWTSIVSFLGSFGMLILGGILVLYIAKSLTS